jgi:hypothetical protein
MPDGAQTGSTESPTYDAIGVGYADKRHPDPRIASRIVEALGGAKNVLNVGAGAGSYEPVDRTVVAVDPSMAMMGQRSSDVGPPIRAVAERLPFRDDAFDAVMAMLTVPTGWTVGRATQSCAGSRRCGWCSPTSPRCTTGSGSSRTTSPR